MELIEGVYYRRKGDDGLWEKFLVKEGSKKADGTVKDLKDWFNPVEDLSCLSWLK